jgi:hypothetical protein
VKFAVALALGLGTMVGWRRIATTIGEKIGKARLSYAQGASAELVTASTIGLADIMGVPVSTTHILASGIAGAMFANRSGLQAATVRNIVLAWVLTIPRLCCLPPFMCCSSTYFEPTARRTSHASDDGGADVTASPNEDVDQVIELWPSMMPVRCRY